MNNEGYFLLCFSVSAFWNPSLFLFYTCLSLPLRSSIPHGKQIDFLGLVVVEDVVWTSSRSCVSRLQNLRRGSGEQTLIKQNKVSLSNFLRKTSEGARVREQNHTTRCSEPGVRVRERLLGSHNYCCILFVFSARETIFFLQYLCPNKIKNLV